MTKPPASPFISAHAHPAGDPFRLLVESVADYAIYLVDPGGLIASWNPASERTFGYRAEEILGQSFTVVYPPEDVQSGRAESMRRQALAEGHHEFEGLRVRKDGSTFFAVVSISEVKDYFGGHAGLSVVTRDITERKAAEEAVRRERDLSDAILRSLPGVYYQYDESGRFLRWNRLFETVTGYSSEEVAALHPLDLFEGEDRKLVAEGIASVFREGRAEVEADLVCKDGRRIPYFLTGARAEVLGQTCLLGMGIDITARRRTDAELRRTGDLLQAVAEAASDAIFVKDRDGRYLLFNPAAARFVGKTAGEVLGRDDTTLFDERGARIAMDHDRRVMESGLPQTSEEELTAAGTTRVYLATKAPYRDREGAVIGVVGISRDITDRTQAERALRVRNDLYAMLAFTNRAVSRCASARELYEEVCRIAVETGRFQYAWVGVPEGDRLPCVASAGDDHGYMGSLVVSLDEADPRSRGPSGRAARTGEAYVINDFLASSMTTAWHAEARRAGFAASAAFPLKEGGRVAAVLTLYAATPGFFTEELEATLGEITPSVSFALDKLAHEREHAGAEKRLEESRALLRVASRLGRMGAWSVELEGLRVIWSEELLDILELPRDHSPSFQYGIDMYLPAYRQAVREAFTRCVENGTPFDLEVQGQTDTGRTMWVRVIGEATRNPDGKIVGARGGLQDISERRRLETQFRHSQKMEAIGRLAGGVAHDFNNLLTVIGGCGDLVLDGLPPGDPLRELVSEIQDATVRASALTRQLLTFSRQQVLAPRLLDLNAVVRDAERMLRRLIGEDVQLVTTLGGDLGPVTADPGQLEQVLMNLVVNARDAMPNGGSLTLETQRVHLDESYCQGVGEVSPGDYVLLAVSDTGCGMDEATRARVFEPFFTTKEPGTGTGLGLATVHGIVTQAGGHAAVYSEPGIGTTFRVYLPVASGRLPESAAPLALPVLPTGTETLLLVEDEAPVRRLAAETLRRCGYRVLEAANGEEALERSAEERGPIDLLVSDVVMPRLGGRALAERFALVRPGCRVLFMSGYTDDAVLRHGVLAPGVAFLQKPFSPAALAQKVRALLDATSGRGEGERAPEP